MEYVPDGRLDTPILRPASSCTKSSWLTKTHHFKLIIIKDDWRWEGLEGPGGWSVRRAT
ncbi:MAG: hypothetical protein QXN15_06065 [Candidatus Jordarchaeales archaeon]